MSTHTFHVSGMHCASCKIFIEDTLNSHELVRVAQVDLKKEILQIETSSTHSPAELADILTNEVASNGYTISVEKTGEGIKDSNDFWKALPIGLGVLALFFLVQKSGLLHIGIGGQITPVTGFLIGLIASVSSCLAVVGGLVLSLSANLAQGTVRNTKILVQFHVARVVSFAMLGGVLGMIGGVIGINFTLTTILGIIASTIMLVLGLNLLGVIKKNNLVFSSRFFNFFTRNKRSIIAPWLLGFATFFLPCGFTQSMQVSALSSGSFLSGLLILFSFALGTLPVLAFLSFGSVSFARGNHASLFFKSAGVVVIGLGLFALLSGLAALGIITPLFSI